MRFYKRDIGIYLPGIIWNPKIGREWCNFDARGGVVDTEDPELIKVLLGFGFPHDEVPKVVEPEVEPKEEPSKSLDFFTEGSAKIDAVVAEVAGGSVGMDVVIDAGEPANAEVESSKYDNREELEAYVLKKYGKPRNIMKKIELEAYALNEFGTVVDMQNNWRQIQKEVKALEEAALDK